MTDMRKVPQIYLFADRIVHYRDYYVVAETPTEAWAKTKAVDETEYDTDVTEAHTDLQRRVQPILLHCMLIVVPVPQREIWIIPTHYEADWRDERANFYGYLINEEDQMVYGEEHAWSREIWEEVPPNLIRQQMVSSCWHFHRTCFEEIYGKERTIQFLERYAEQGGTQYRTCFAFECPRGTLCMICYDEV